MSASDRILSIGYDNGGPMIRLKSMLIVACTLFSVLAIWLSILSPGLARDLNTSQGVPLLPGAYKNSFQYPRVFMTRGEFVDLAARINVSGSYSARRFTQLAAQVARDLGADNKWDTAYSGCNTDTYNYAFSYEPQTIHGEDHVAKVRSDMDLRGT